RRNAPAASDRAVRSDPPPRWDTSLQATGTRQAAASALRAASCLSCRQTRQARQDLARPGLGRQGTHVLVHHDALRADEECFGGAIPPPVDRGAAGVISRDRLVRIAELSEPGDRLRIIVLPVEADDRHDAGALYLEQRLVLRAAFSTPGPP